MTIQNWLFIKDIKSEINSRGEDRKYCQGPKTISCYLGGHSKLAREENKACITSCNLYWAFYKLELQPGGEKRHYQCKTIVKNKIMETRHFQHLPFLKHLARQQILLTNWCKSLCCIFPFKGTVNPKCKKRLTKIPLMAQTPKNLEHEKVCDKIHSSSRWCHNGSR